MGGVQKKGASYEYDLLAGGVCRHGRRVAGSNTETDGPMVRTGLERRGDVHSSDRP